MKTTPPSTSTKPDLFQLPERPPALGELVRVRSRRWLVEEVVEPPRPGQVARVRLACADDDNQGQTLEVYWEYEPDRLILEEEGWSELPAKGFDPPRHFAAFLHTLRWGCVTATDPDLFQAPFRAGIKIDAYQMEPLRKALRLPRANLFIADGGDWPGRARPHVLYDPRALEPERPGGVLHAKAVVADEEAVFITSANFTEAALDRNIELGVLLRDPALAASLASHFRTLIDRGLLKPLPAA